MRIFSSEGNLMSDILDELEKESQTLPKGFSPQFRAGILWAVESLRKGVTNMGTEGVIINEAQLVPTSPTVCDCGCGFPISKP